MPTKKQKPRPEAKAAELVQVRIYKNDHGVLKRIAMRKSIGKERGRERGMERGRERGKERGSLQNVPHASKAPEELRMTRLCLTCKRQTEQTLEPYSPGMKQWYCHEHRGAAWIRSGK